MNRQATVLLSGVALLTVGSDVAYHVRNMERRSLGPVERAGATGKFVNLRDGITHYDLSGPDSGRTIVLLSDATVPFYLWDPTRDALAADGFRVLRYDYYGRGFSDRPKLRYDLAAYDSQLTELLDSLGLRGQVDIAGVSMGGVVAANFADRHPARIRSLILIDPGFSAVPNTPFPLGIPGVGEVIITIAAPTMAKGQLGDFLHPERYPDWVARYEVQMRFKGFRRAFLATLRGDAFKRSAGSFRALAQSRIPVLIVWGAEGQTVPSSMSGAVHSAFPGAEFHAIQGAAHLPQIEQPARVHSILLTFLRHN